MLYGRLMISISLLSEGVRLDEGEGVRKGNHSFFVAILKDMELVCSRIGRFTGFIPWLQA